MNAIRFIIVFFHLLIPDYSHIYKKCDISAQYIALIHRQSIHFRYLCRYKENLERGMANSSAQRNTQLVINNSRAKRAYLSSLMPENWSFDVVISIVKAEHNLATEQACSRLHLILKL